MSLDVEPQNLRGQDQPDVHLLRVDKAEQFEIWLDHCGIEEVLYAIKTTARKFERLGGKKMSPDYQLRYCRRVMNVRAQEAQQ